MNYHDITKDDMLNGDGLRVVLWVSGCDHNCPECQNPITWDHNSGLEFDEAAKAEIFAQLDKPYINGLTFSGGDPLYFANRDAVFAFAKEVKEKYPAKTIWLYTGFSYETIAELEVFDFIDVLVDGEYEKDKRDTTLSWRGSSNQRVIDIKATRAAKEIVLHCQ